MRKSPLFNISITLTGRLIDSLFMLVFYATAARSLGKESFGIFLYATSVAILLTAFSDLGFSSLIIREIAKDQRRGLNLFADITGFRIVIILVILILTWAGGHLFFQKPVVLNTVFF